MNLHIELGEPDEDMVWAHGGFPFKGFESLWGSRMQFKRVNGVVYLSGKSAY